jgi:hypothetical protein
VKKQIRASSREDLRFRGRGGGPLRKWSGANKLMESELLRLRGELRESDLGASVLMLLSNMLQGAAPASVCESLSAPPSMVGFAAPVSRSTAKTSCSSLIYEASGANKLMESELLRLRGELRESDLGASVQEAAAPASVCESLSAPPSMVGFAAPVSRSTAKTSTPQLVDL